VITVAALAGCAGDVFFFALGRRFGPPVLQRFPALAARFARADALIQRHSTWFILALRFMYGLRTAGALALGMSRVRWSTFLVLNFCGAWLWATTVSIAGYALAETLERLLADVGRYEHWVILGLIAAGAAVWLAQRVRTRRAAAGSRSSG
jgi:membrane protein DedA with SNARE-associated domain